MQFNTVGSDLEGAAVAAVEYFREKGFAVKVEPYEFDYPSTPTIRCTRGKAKLFIEAASAVNQGGVDAWVAYAKTREHETSLGLLVRTPPGLSLEDVAALRRQRVALYSYSSGAIEELVPPSDLAVNIALPSLEGLKPAHKRLLQPSFEKIERGEWIDGFRDACQALEDTARELLKDGVKRGRVAFTSKAGKVLNYSIKEIGKMPQGALARAYAEIQKPTQSDIVLSRALKMVNKARIAAVHKTQKAKNDAKIRVQVGQHLWTVVSAFRQLK